MARISRNIIKQLGQKPVFFLLLIMIIIKVVMTLISVTQWHSWLAPTFISFPATLLEYGTLFPYIAPCNGFKSAGTPCCDLLYPAHFSCLANKFAKQNFLSNNLTKFEPWSHYNGNLSCCQHLSHDPCIHNTYKNAKIHYTK